MQHITLALKPTSVENRQAKKCRPLDGVDAKKLSNLSLLAYLRTLRVLVYKEIILQLSAKGRPTLERG